MATIKTKFARVQVLGSVPLPLTDPALAALLATYASHLYTSSAAGGARLGFTTGPNGGGTLVSLLPGQVLEVVSKDGVAAWDFPGVEVLGESSLGSGYVGGVARITLGMTESALNALTKTTKVRVSYTFQNGYGSTYTERTGKVDVKLRGNFTAGLPQKPIAANFVTSDGKDDKTPLLPNYYADSDYVFLPSYADPTGLRTYLIQSLAASLGNVAVKTCPIDVYTLDGYYGWCTVTEKVKNALVNLAAPTAPTTPAADFGYMFETELVSQEDLSTQNTFKTALWGDNYQGPNQAGVAHCVAIDYPKFGKLTPEQATYAQNQWLKMEGTLAFPWTDLVNGPQSMLNKAALFSFWAAVEFSRSIDMISHSLFAFIQPGGKFVFIPWDYDLCLGTYTFANIQGIDPATNLIAQCPIFNVLHADADCLAEFKQYYTTVAAPAVAATIARTKQRGQLLADTQAAARNIAKWGTTTTGYAVFYADNSTHADYQYHVDALLGPTGAATLRAAALAARYASTAN